MTSARRLWLAALAVIAAGGIGALVMFLPDLRSGAAGAKAIGGPFTLTAGDGTTVTDRSFPGRWLLVYFGYTHCPNICPVTLLALSQALDQLGPLAAKAQPVFVTVDPERDTPAVMAEFTGAFDSRIVGLTGKPSDIAAVAKEYRVFYKKVPGETADEYSMEHSSYIYVIDPAGHYVTLFSSDEAQRPERIAARLRELLASPSQNSNHKPFGGSRPRRAALSE